jgi:hypothetical protein
MDRRLLCIIGALSAFVSMSALAQEDAFVSPTQSAAESAARRQSAEDSFQNIIAPQNMEFDNAVRSKAPISGEDYRPAPRRAADMPYPDSNSAAPSPIVTSTSNTSEDRKVTLSLEAYQQLQDKLNAQREKNVLLEGPAVILGASEYTGKALSGALSLSLKLKIILGAGNKWKTVPLIGEDVVLVSAEVNNAPIPTSRQNGFIVWTTQKTGEMTVDIEMLVPSRGPKGSIEYDFFAPKTPVTRFSCFFPVAGLEPQIADTQQSQVAEKDGGTFVEAVLRPTSRIHFVGYKDIKSDEETPAGLFTETMNLVSIGEGTIDLFSVFRYTILYAGAKEFVIEIPKDMAVVSAEGESAFSFVMEEEGDKSLMRGETAFPIRNNFEISLRLKKNIKPGEIIDVPLPHAVNAEREHGWIAVEVLGKLQIKEKSKEEVTALDVRQLPEEMVRSAVSPIVKAYRFHTPKAKVALVAQKLPEKEPMSDSVDRIRVFSVISKDGKMLTDMRIRMRNHLRPTLAVKLLRGQKLLSAHLDGEAVRPSQEGGNTIILPLKRSEGDDAMEPFTLQIVMESTILALGLFGSKNLELPSVELPVSSVEWTIFVPADNTYSELKGDADKEVAAGEAVWYAPPFSAAPVRTFVRRDDSGEGNAELTSEGTGVVAVRIELPKTGTRLDYLGYWVDANRLVSVHFDYVRSRLLIPIGIIAVLIAAFGAALLIVGWKGKPIFRFVGFALVAAAYYPMVKAVGIFGLIGALPLTAAAVIHRLKWFPRIKVWTAEWATTMGARFKERDKDETKVKVTRVIVAVLMLIVLYVLLGVGASVVRLLFSPL